MWILLNIYCCNVRSAQLRNVYWGILIECYHFDLHSLFCFVFFTKKENYMKFTRLYASVFTEKDKIWMQVSKPIAWLLDIYSNHGNFDKCHFTKSKSLEVSSLLDKYTALTTSLQTLNIQTNLSINVTWLTANCSIFPQLHSWLGSLLYQVCLCKLRALVL